MEALPELIRIAIIGAGYMGSAHARVINRVISENPGIAELSYIVDIDRERAEKVSRKYGGKPLTSINDIPRGTVDLAFIATPTEYHFESFKTLADKDVKYFFIEKPMTRNLKQAAELIKRAEENDLWITVGHIERYNPAVKKLHQHVGQGKLGEILTMISRRVGPFVARVKNTDVIYDLGIHEIDNSLAINREYPLRIRSYTLENVVSRLNDYALIILQYDRGFSSLEVNRVTPFKQRILYITAEKGVVFLDYMKQELYIYNSEHETKVIIHKEEPLFLEDRDTIMSIVDGRKPPIDPYQAFASLFLCELALESTRESREIIIEEHDKYNTYRDLINKGLEGYRSYIEKKLIKKG